MKIHRPINDPRKALVRRLATATTALLTVLCVGTGGYVLIGQGRWSTIDALYMTIITLSTVGYGETLPGMDESIPARAWTVLMIVLGSGTLLYYMSTLTAFIIEGDLRGVIARNRMQRQIERLNDHLIVCGVGATGSHVAHELATTHKNFVVIESDEARVAWVQQEYGIEFPFVLGDATEEKVLAQAGIERAKGLITTLSDDRDNLFLTITARSMRDTLRIVAKAVEPDNIPKLRRAGADAIVSPAGIGGLRMVSEMVRPTVVQFLDAMVRSEGPTRRIEELSLTSTCKVIGHTLAELEFRSFTDALVVGMRYADGRMLYNPPANTALEAGATLILLSKTDDIPKIRAELEARK